MSYKARLSMGKNKFLKNILPDSTYQMSSDLPRFILNFIQLFNFPSPVCPKPVFGCVAYIFFE